MDKLCSVLLYLGADPSLTGDIMDFFDNLGGVFQNYTDGQAYLSLALAAGDLAVHGDVKPNGRLYSDATDKVSSTSSSEVGISYKKEKKISKNLYKKLREKTPTDKIKDMINKDIDKLIGTKDPALGQIITQRLEADHIVPMKKIVEMKDFEKLVFNEQLEVLNNTNNFFGLTKVANTSKGSKTYEEWILYKKGNIHVNTEFRREMIKREKQLEIELQKQIDMLNKKER